MISGGYCEKVTPVPIPNTVVKLLSADDTGISWESRTLPDFSPSMHLRMYRGFFYARMATSYFPNVASGDRHDVR